MSALALLSGLALGAAAGAGAAWALARRGRRAEADGRSLAARVAESPAVGILVVRDGRIAWINGAGGAILGAPPEDLAGVEVRAFHLEADSDFLCGPGQAVAHLGEHRLRRLDGSPFWAILAGAPLDPQDGAAGYLWFFRDATGQVEFRQDLEEVLALNQKLIEASPVAIMLYRAADGGCVLANPAASRVIGGTREQLLAQNFRRIRSWQESGLRALADEALATLEERSVSTRLETSFGREVWVDGGFVPFESRGEKMLMLLLDDVSERVKAAQALRDSEENYRAVVEALNEGLTVLDQQGRCVYVNGRLASMLGYPREALIGREWSMVVSPEVARELRMRQVLSSDEDPGPIDIALSRPDGTPMEVRVSIAKVKDAEGRRLPSPVLVTDVSAQKRAEREREGFLAEVAQKNKELETLLYVASHDLRSPLVNIQGFSRRLEEAATLEELRPGLEPLLRERMPSALEFIRASGVKMDGIINGLLSLSRAGRMVIRPEQLDMDALLRTCAASVAFQLQSAGGTLEVDPLPSCRADAAQVTQIFSNLLDNALKYRDRGRTLRIRVWGQVEPDRVRYWVEDNGVGIAPQHRERIWDIFQRLDPQGEVPGEGLGLTLVRRMVERNGGKVGVGDGAENGCRFEVELPLG